MIYYRPHRGSLDDSMKELKKFETKNDMLEYICYEHNSRFHFFQITPEEIFIEEYGSDERVGWGNCFICCFEKPSKIKNIEGYKKYFGCSEKDKWFANDYPTGVIGMFTIKNKRKMGVTNNE